MNVIHDITMDLIRPGVRPLVCGVQGERVSRGIRFHLTRSGIAFPVPESTAAVVRFRKSDGTGGIYDTLPDGSLCCSISGNTVTAILAPQVLTCPGPVDLQLELRQKDSVLATFSVCVLVDADPSAGADPSENYLNWMEATVDALAAYLKEYPLPGGSGMCPRDEKELAQYLAEGRAVLIAKPFPLSGPIVINRSGTYLEFAPGVTLDLTGKDFPAILVTYQADGSKPSFVTVKNASVSGDGTKGSVGIRLEAMSYDCHIEKLNVNSCEFGIQTTGGFDCAQQNTFYEPYICNCRIGIEDSGGGLQNCRFYGGRIESNDEWGLVSASPNLCFDGTMIQGNTLGEVKLVNMYTDVYSMVSKSGGIFTNCYFEHLQRYGEAGEAIMDSVFQLGDEAQGDGWFGHLSLVGCKIGHFGNYAVRCNGRGAMLPGHAEHNLQTIQLVGCTCHGKQIFYLPNMDFGCRILVVGPTQGQEKQLYVDVGETVVMEYLNNQYSRIGHAQATAITGVNAPMDYAHTRQLYLEPFGYEIDENGYPVTDGSGNYIPKSSYGNWIEATTSALPPWLESDTGINGGSLHYASKYTAGFKSPGWFVRTGSKTQKLDEETGEPAVDEEGRPVLEDGDGNWSSLITGNARGVIPNAHTRQLQLERDGSDYGDWITFTYSDKLPWDHDGTGIVKGSLHFCSANGCWYQRIAGKPDQDTAACWGRLIQGDSDGIVTRMPARQLMVVGSNNAALSVTYSNTLPWLDETTGERAGSLHYCGGWYERTEHRGDADSEEKWVRLAREDALAAVRGQYSNLEYTATEGTYIETKGYVNTYGSADFLTHRYAVSAGKTYAISGQGVRWHLAGYPLAIFTGTLDYGDTNIGTVLVDGTASNVETDYTGDKAVTFTPETDGYIWIAAHTAYTPLTVQELTFGEGETMGIVLKSSTPGSTKKFVLTVDDTGNLTPVPYRD